jgi:3-hydroxyisobutyrate dehydrogenase
VVGVGRMGANMALRLKDKGYTIAAVYDRRAESAAKSAAETGAKQVGTLAEITALADVVITVVTDDAAMYEIYAETGDSLLGGAKGTIFINTATVSPAVHVEVERRAHARGAMIGGKRETFDRVRPLLESLSSSLRYIGPAGTAAQVKALVNMVMNINTAGLAEGLGLGDALGLDLTMLREVFSQTGAASRVLETDGLDMQNREHEVYFSAAHAAKDSHIANALGAEFGLALPVSEATAAQFDRMVARGLGELDKSGVAELTFRSRSMEKASR